MNKSNHRLLPRAWPLLVVLLVAVVSGPAADTKPSVSLTQIDRDGDGRLSEDEYRALQDVAAKVFGYDQLVKPALERKDEDIVKQLLGQDGKLPPDKLTVLLLATQGSAPKDANLDTHFDAADVPLQQTLTKKETAKLEPKLSDLKEFLGDDYSEENVLAGLESLGGGGAKKGAALFGWLRLRESAEIDLDDLNDLKKAKPATLNFTHDYKDQGRETTDLKLALIAPFTADGRPARASNLGLSAYYLPAVAWEKVNGTADKDVDLTTVSLGAGWVWKDRHALIHVQETVLTASYLHDREKSSSLFKAELAYKPVSHNLGLGSYFLLGGLPVQARLDLALRASTIQVMDAGTDPDLGARDDTVRLGGSLGLTLRPANEAWQRLTFATTYTYDSALSGSPQKADLLDVSLQLQLDETGHYSVELNYQNGEVTLLEVPTDKLVLQLGVKY